MKNTEVTKAAKLVAEILSSAPFHKLGSYTPYPWQKEFHKAGADNTERMLMAANRVGKCVTYQTLIETLNGPVAAGELFESGVPFDVWAWDGEKAVPARALKPFKKEGLHKCYRLFTRCGWVECADHHRLFAGGVWVTCEQLLASAPIPKVSSLVSGLLTRVLGVRRYLEKLGGFLAGYLPDFRFCGEQPRMALSAAPAKIPLQAGVLQHISVLWSEGGRDNKYTNSRQQACVRLSSPDVPRLAGGRYAAFLTQGACLFDALCRGARRAFQQLSTAEGPYLRQAAGYSFQVSHTLRARKGACASPLLEVNDIIAYHPIGRQEVYDFTVLEHHNYIAGGLVHHNTLSAGAEMAFHLTGIYPEYWEGMRFKKPVLGWTGSPTNETSKDIVQKELLGGLGEDLGTGWIPKKLITGKPTTRQAGVRGVVDTFSVRHVSGGKSTCILKTYEQGWRKWQGTAPHVVWLDEEPEDYMIYSETQTRVMTSNGLVMVTFTPLLGVTELVQHFMDGGDGIYLKTATWDDAPHLDEDAKARLRASYRAHERDARTRGIPMMGEGAVFPVEDGQISVQPWDIPDHYARIKGCDFGIDHPAAGVEIAWDRDTDIIYVIDCYKKAGETAPYHAAWFNKNHKWLPVSWPHDGMNREKTGGRTLADAYRSYSVNMLSKSARYPKTPGEKEKGGAQAVEPIVDEVLDRMLTGRFKVFSHLSEWFDEKRSYHRKDGKIVDRRDDILKATFYAVMMKRYAVSLTNAGRLISRAPTRPIVSVRL